MQFLVTASVFIFIVLKLLGAASAEGSITRSGEPSLGIVERVGRVDGPYEVRNISIPGDACVDLPGWTDSYGYGCEHYIDDEGDCEKYSDDVGSDGKTPLDACCVCQNVSSGSCFDLPGWTDFFEDSCDWYEENEPVGCPGEGHVNGTNNVNASEACCHCHSATGINERDDTHGKAMNYIQPDTFAGDSTSFSSLYSERTIWTIVIAVMLILCLSCFCCMCF